MQGMYIYLCCYAIWDVGGVWSWLVVAQRKTIKAVARYSANGRVAHVLTVSRQGLHHSYLTLIADTPSQMLTQAPVYDNGDIAHSKKVLQVASTLMGESFNENDSLCKCLRPIYGDVQC